MNIYLIKNIIRYIYIFNSLFSNREALPPVLGYNHNGSVASITSISKRRMQINLLDKYILTIPNIHTL